MTKWYELAENKLKEDDEIKKSFSGEFDGEDGYLVMSGEKLLFVDEEGLIFKKYEVTHDISYDEIGKINYKNKNEMTIKEVEGEMHTFQTDDLPIAVVTSSLGILKNPQPVDRKYLPMDH